MHAHGCGHVASALKEPASDSRVGVKVCHNDVNGAGRADCTIGSDVVGFKRMRQCVGLQGTDILNLVPGLVEELVGERPVALPESLVVCEKDVEVVSLKADGGVAAARLDLVAASPAIGHSGLVECDVCLVLSHVVSARVEVVDVVYLIASATRVKIRLDTKLAKHCEWILKEAC